MAEGIESSDSGKGSFFDYDFLNGTNVSCDVQDHLSSPLFQGTVYVCYVSVLLAALLGNGLVCYVVYASPRMWTVTNYFIVNLAVGDVLLALLCVPFSFLSTLILRHWPFGPELCKTVSFSQATSVLVSAYTLVAISLDRYVAIRWPLRPRLSKCHAKAVIACVWFVALLTASPIAFVSSLIQPDDWHKACDIFICMEIWPQPHSKYYYSMALMTLQYMLPLTVLVITYSLIASVVWGQRTPGEAQNQRDQRNARSKRKMIKMMVTVVIVFTICWLPYNVLLVALDRDERVAKWFLLPYMYFAFHWLAMSHSCYNPVIYCWMNARFRQGFQSTLARVPGLRQLVLRGSSGSGSGRGRHRGRSGSLAGIALTGMEASDGGASSGLHRVPTCTSWAGYNSVKRPPGSLSAARARGISPPRSASLRVAFAAAPQPPPPLPPPNNNYAGLPPAVDGNAVRA